MILVFMRNGWLPSQSELHNVLFDAKMPIQCPTNLRQLKLFMLHSKDDCMAVSSL